MYKAAIIGLGKIGLLYDLEQQRPHPSSHVLAYEMSDAFQLVCGIDSDAGRKEELLRLSPDSLFLNSLEKAIKVGVLNDVNVISICTPPKTHLSILHRLLEADVGKVIFCEKPLVSAIDEVDSLLQMANHSDTIIIPNISRRWNGGLRKVAHVVESGQYGTLEKINIRYTRGIYNTGSHLFDLLKMWTGIRISRVFVTSETETSALPEKTFSFCFEMENGIRGYAEAIDDRNYYQFDIDLFLSGGKIEIRNSGDDVYYYQTAKHHLFDGFQELIIKKHEGNLLCDSCMKNAIDNIEGILDGTKRTACTLKDAIEPLYVARALEESFEKKSFAEVRYE